MSGIPYIAPTIVRRGLAWSGVAFAALHAGATGALAAQILIDHAEVNVLSATLAWLSSTITLEYLRLSRAFESAPLSSFALLGMCVTSQWGALVAQSAAWTPVAENLREPIRTFSLLAIFQGVAILAHLIHRSLGFLVLLRNLASNGLSRLGIFEVPSPGTLWLMGAVGFAAYAVAHSPGDVNLGDRLLAGFWPFAWAPFLIPILHARHGPTYCRLRLHGSLLAVYAVTNVGLAMALNARVLMVQGGTTAALMTLLILLKSEGHFSSRGLWRLVLFLLLALALVQPLGYLATAMAVARADRGHISQLELLKETIDVLKDASAVENFREQVKTDSKLSAYDETYIANSVVARFVVTKFQDNVFYFGKNLSDQEHDGLAQEEISRVWSMLPYPVLRGFKIPVDKLILGHSTADYYANLRTGVPLGGLKAGSLLGDCLALFDEAAGVVYLAYCLVAFFFWETLSRVEGSGAAQVSVLAMLQVYVLFTLGINNESLAGGLAFEVRAFWQNLAFYLLTYLLARMVFPPFRPV